MRGEGATDAYTAIVIPARGGGGTTSYTNAVIPAEAGIQRRVRPTIVGLGLGWIPASAGMTGRGEWGARLRLLAKALLLILGLATAGAAFAQTNPVDLAAQALSSAAGPGRQPLSLSLQVLILMTLLTVLPSVLLMMTSFTRILIVLAVLRQALGLAQTPPNQVLVGLSLFLTLFVMAPTLSEVNGRVLEPYAAGAMPLETAIETAGQSFHRFMIAQTRQKDIKLFADIAKVGPFAQPADVPFSILLPAFVTSELKTAFQIGFLIFLPFLVIDLVVASVLMALGMMMLSPTLISLPFKLLLFVLVDGWALTMGSLASSFYPPGA